MGPQPAPQPWPSESRGTSPPASARADKASAEANALLAFRSETKPDPKTRRPARSRLVRLITIGASIVVLLGATTAAVLSTQFVQAKRPPTPAPPTSAVAPVVAEGTMTIDSRPEGAQVSIDGVVRGVTPLKLTLPAGNHTLELQNGGAARSLPVTVQVGAIVSQYIDLAPPAAAAGLTVGRLEITSDPVGARVSVDGVARGVTPVALASVPPGSHAVVVTDGDTTIMRTVVVASGSTASVVVSMTPAGSVAGWLVLKAPFEMRVLEGGQLIGTTTTDRLMLPAGRHDLTLSNAAFEFEAPMTVQIAAGKIVTPTVAIPNGSLSINAIPWADVFLDGQAIGTTPLANLSVPIGNHEILCKHPQLGERRQTVVVKVRTPVRIGLSFNK